MMQKRFSTDRYFFIIISFLALWGAGYGVMHLPQVYAERDKTLDLKRIQDLQVLSDEIEYYAQTYSTLPESIEMVAERPSYGLYDSQTKLPLSDPQTGQKYGYAKINQSDYQLCTTFATDTTNSPELRDDYLYFQKHPQGYHCFTLSYEPWDTYEPNKDNDLYPPFPTPTFVCLGQDCPTINGKGNEPANIESSSTPAEANPRYQEAY